MRTVLGIRCVFKSVICFWNVDLGRLDSFLSAAKNFLGSLGEEGFGKSILPWKQCRRRGGSGGEVEDLSLGF